MYMYFICENFCFGVFLVELKFLLSRGCVTTDFEMYDIGDDEILEVCVRTVIVVSIRVFRERKRVSKYRKFCKFFNCVIIFYFFY